MAEKGFKRKLAAILSADVEGYSRLMGEDEEATVRTLTSYRAAIADLVHQFRGRIVDTPGDNILADFTSVVDAANCAVEIQRELAERNAELPYSRRMQFRIGVNLGDVIEEEGRIYGDGVNIAARVEAIAEAGGICISGRAYDQVANKLGLEYENLGEHKVKNISTPIRVYRVLSFPGAAAHRVIQLKHALKKKWLWVAVTTIIFPLIIFFVLFYKFYYLPAPAEIDPKGKMTFDLSRGPAIAVLPFVNMSGDPEQDYFCDGIAENLTSSLSHIQRIFVIARNSAFSYKGKSVKVQQIGYELGADYLIEGSIQKSNDRIRITVQLVETKSGNHIWAEIYDRTLEDIFELQDEITIDTLKAIGISISGGVQIRGLYEGISDLQIFIKFLKFWAYFHRFNREGNDLARKEALEIIDLDDQIPLIYAFLGFVYLHDIYYGACESTTVCFGQATEAARKALTLDERNHKAHQLAGYIFLMRKEYEKAINEIKHSIILNPNCADCYLVLGQTYWSYGNPKDGLDYIKKAFLLNPKPQSNYYVQLGCARYLLNDHENAIEAFKKGISTEPNNIFSHIGLATVYATIGREKDAKIEGLEISRIDPNFSINKFAKTIPLKSPAELNRFAVALRIAGLN